MTRIRFIITSGSSIVLGANIEPLASVDEILRTINYRIYQQCTPYISLNILLTLRLCIPMNEISLWTNLIATAVATATGRFILLPGRVDWVLLQDKRMSLCCWKVFSQESHQLGRCIPLIEETADRYFFRSQPANIAYFLITINGMTYNQTLSTNLSVNPLLLATIAQGNSQLLCPNQTQILPYQNSIQDFSAPCPIPQL